MMIEAFHQTGLPIADYNEANQMTTMIAQSITEKGKRVSTNNAFMQPIRYRRKNLTVKIKSEVFKILINDTKHAYGVVYRRNGTVHEAYAKKEVIVCGGTINSPKLLMLSGIGPKEHLNKLNITVIQNLAVGENLHDHVTFNGIIVALNKSSTLIGRDEILDEVRKYKKMKQKRGPLSGDGIANSLAFIKTEPWLIAPDIQIQIGGIYLKDYIKELVNFDSIPIMPTSFYDGMLLRAMNLVPNSRGKLLLNETNPQGPPVMYAKYLDDPADVVPLIKAFRYLISLENTNAFKSRGAYYVKTPYKPCAAYDWGSNEYLTCMAYQFTSSTYHPAGTCKMGPMLDQKAVVDPKLKVYGISGLRVIDCSIMPILVRGNTNAPSIMIGERGVAFVIDYWQNK